MQLSSSKNFQRIPVRREADKSDCIYTYKIPTRRDRLLDTKRQNAISLHFVFTHNGNSRGNPRRDDGYYTSGIPASLQDIQAVISTVAHGEYLSNRIMKKYLRTVTCETARANGLKLMGIQKLNLSEVLSLLLEKMYKRLMLPAPYANLGVRRCKTYCSRR